MPLHQYFWSITVKVRWCSFAPGLLVCGHWRNIWRCKTQKKNKEKEKMHTEKNTCTVSTPAVFPNTRDVSSLIPCNNTTRDAAPSQRVHTVGKGRTDETHNLFPAVKMESRNTKTMRSYDYNLLLLGCKIQAWLLTRHKNVFPKVSIQ